MGIATVPISAFRNSRLADARFGDFFLADDGEKFIVGQAANGKEVAVMIQGDFGKHCPFYFAPLDQWTRHGVVALTAKLVVDPSSLARSDSVPPGSISLDRGTVHIAGFSGQTYQPIAISGKGEQPAKDAAAFTRWTMFVEGADSEPVELFAFGSQ